MTRNAESMQSDSKPTIIDDQDREAYWINVEKKEVKRHIFGKRIVHELVIIPGRYTPSTTSIPIDDIANISDPDLRYALRLQDASNSVGWFEHEVGDKSGHNVMIKAAGTDFDSEFVSAQYSGVIDTNGVDTFMENLRRISPDYSGGYGEE